MSRLKDYDWSTGVLLDSNFLEHKVACESCRNFNPERPSTAAALCLEGAVLWKRENTTLAKREHI